MASMRRESADRDRARSTSLGDEGVRTVSRQGDARAGDSEHEQTIPKSARADSLFYAHLYVGLYYESLQQKEKALQHIQKAVEKYPSSHYMGDVVRVHLQLRGQHKK